MGLQPCIWCTGRMMQLPSCATAATRTQATHTAQQNRGGATPAAPPARSPWPPTRGCTSAAGVTSVIQREQSSALRGQALLLLLGLLSGCAAASGTPAPVGKQAAGGGWSSCCRPAPAMKQVAARVGLLPPAPTIFKGCYMPPGGCVLPGGAAALQVLHVSGPCIQRAKWPVPRQCSHGSSPCATQQGERRWMVVGRHTGSRAPQGQTLPTHRPPSRTAHAPLSCWASCPATAMHSALCMQLGDVCISANVQVGMLARASDAV